MSIYDKLKKMITTTLFEEDKVIAEVELMTVPL